MIRANIEKKTKRTLTIPTEQIALINNTKNYDVKFDDSELKVKISGLRSVVDKVVVKDLNPKIDMQLYEPGTHTVQVQLTKIKNMSIEKNVSAKITVELNIWRDIYNGLDVIGCSSRLYRRTDDQENSSGGRRPA